MQDLYKGFKKISEDEKKALLEHENGHQLTIAKQGLSRKQKHALSKLPLHQARGTQPIEEEPSDMGQEATQIGQTIVEGVASKILEGANQSIQREPQGLREDLAQYQQEQQGLPEETPASFAEKLASIQPAPQEQELAAHESLAPQQMVPTDSILGGPGIMVPVEQAAPEQAGLVEQKGLAPETRELAEKPQEEMPPPSQMPAPAMAPAAVPKYETLMDVAADPNQPESVRIEALMQEQVRLLKQYDDALTGWKDMMATKPDNEKATAFSNRNTWGKIGRAIGLMLGGMSSGLTGQKNPVLELVNKEIEEETIRQKNASDAEMNLYKMNLQTLGDKRQAYLQTINQLRELSQLKADELLSKAGNNPKTKMAAEAIYAENRAKIAKANTERAQFVMSNVMKAKQAAGVPGEVPDMYDPMLDRAIRIKLPTGQVIKKYVKDKALAKEASEDFSQLRRVQDLLQAINSFNQQYGQTTSIPLIGSKELNEQAKSLNEQAKTEITKLMSGRAGTLRPGLLEKFDQIMPQAGAMFWNQPEQQARTIEALRMVDRLRQELSDQYLVQ